MTQQETQQVTLSPHNPEQVREELTNETQKIISGVEESDEVKLTAVRLDICQEESQKIRSASMALLEDAAALRREYQKALDETRNVLVSDRAEAKKLDTARISLLVQKAEQAKAAMNFVLETQHFTLVHAQKLTSFRETIARSEYLRARAAGITKVANERMAQTMLAMKEVVQREGVLSFDPRTTLSGQLLEQAQRLDLEADRLLDEGAEIWQKYQELCGHIREIPLPTDYKLI